MLLAQLIARSFAVPVATIGLIGFDEVLVLAEEGLGGLRRFARAGSICEALLNRNGAVAVGDRSYQHSAGFHPLMPDGTLATFCCAVPLRTAGGAIIGAVCLASPTPRRVRPQELETLSLFAGVVMEHLELKAEVEKRARTIAEKDYQLKQAFRLAKIGTWEFDLVHTRAIWSEELYNVYEIKPQEKKETDLDTYLSLVHPDDLPGLLERLRNPDAISEFATERLLKKDGSVLYIQTVRQKVYDENGKLIKMVGLSQNITRQVLYEQKLQNSEERFRALVQNNSDLIAVLDEAGTMLYISPASVQISGYTPEELIGRNVFDFMHPDDREQLVAELERVTNRTNTGEHTLHRFRAKNGDWVWLESKGMNMAGTVAPGGIIINARDVTERKRLQERLAIEQKNRQRDITSAVIKAQEAERSDVGRELHDNVNQVLTTVKLYLEMLGDGLADPKELVVKATYHLQNCIDEIRSISRRLSAPKPGELSLNDSIRELVESINLTNRIQISYTSDHLAGLPIPQEMHLAVYRIIQEQLNNVLKYAAATQVTIRLHYHEAELRLLIVDNGRGFDTRIRRAGIGITNMRTRAENLSGQFDISSQPGEGCRLEVRFPLPAGGPPPES